MTLWNLKSAIDAGQTAERRDAYDSVIIFVQDNWYYAQYGDGGHEQFGTFTFLTKSLGEWASYGDWRLQKAVK